MYDMIFKRKSFHLFRNVGQEKLTEADICDIKNAYEKFVPLYADIKTAIRIMPSEKTLGRGAEYAIEIYSEKKENYKMNAGYLGQQLDHYLVSKNIGTLWFGIGKPEENEYEGLTYVIMILIAKVDDEKKFRKDMFKSKRKSVEEIWTGPQIKGVSDISRFAPSACNSQPWRIQNEDGVLTVRRYLKPARIGIMSIVAARYFNCIDMGIYLRFLELCLTHEGYNFDRELFADSGDEAENTIVAKYSIRHI
ncbi:MAG: nitroreductase family protein [Lachnospiraceae bacterium]|nr:nitroreductase family protein [Lachnospiraceae bacterium]